MVDRDVIEKVARVFGTALVTCKIRGNWKQTYRAQLRGSRAVELMKRLRPIMGQRRQHQIDLVVYSYSPDPDHWTRRPRPWPDDEVLLDWARGLSTRDIAALIHVSHQAVHQRLKKLQNI